MSTALAASTLRRLLLWAALVLLVLALLAMLVWLAGRYEISQIQSRLERDATDTVTDLQATFARNAQSLLGLPNDEARAGTWADEARAMLRQRRELVRIERRDNQRTSPSIFPIIARFAELKTTCGAMRPGPPAAGVKTPNSAKASPLARTP